MRLAYVWRHLMVASYTLFVSGLLVVSSMQPQFPKIVTVHGKTEDIEPIIHQYDVLRREKRGAGSLETTQLLVTSDREIRSLRSNLQGTPVALSERRFNLTACLEAQNRWKRTAHFEYERYHQLHEIHVWMDDTARKYPDKVAVFEIARSFENRPLKAFKISVGSGNLKPAVWVDGGIHAREWISPATVIYFVKTLLENYETNSTVRWMLDAADWYILPVFNVDGYIFSWEKDRMWRKTRSTHPNSDCLGADPNRNWDYHWGDVESNIDPCSNSYVGQHPFSEIEVREVANFIKQKSNIKMYLTYHNAGQKYIIPWGYTTERIPDYDELMSLCKTATDVVEDVNGLPYVCNGVTDFFGVLPGVSNDYVYGALGIKHSFAIELRDRSDGFSQGYFFCLPEEQIVDTARENFAGLVTLMTESKLFQESKAKDTEGPEYSLDVVTSPEQEVNIGNSLISNIRVWQTCILLIAYTHI